MSKSNENFAEIIAGHFHDILRASGVAMMRVDSHEKIRDASRRMALSIEHRAEQEAIKVFKRLQAAVVDGFNNMEDDIKELKKTNKHLSVIVDLQTQLLEHHVKHLDALSRGETYVKPFIVKEGDPEMGSTSWILEDEKVRVEETGTEPAFEFEAEDEGPA